MMFAIKNIKANRVNLLMNDLVCGMPSPLSMIGFADAIVRRLNLKPWSASVFPIYHEVNLSNGRTRAEYKNEGKKFKPAEIPEDLIGHVNMSLLIDIPGFDETNRLTNIIESLKIAGGFIEPGFTVDNVKFDENILNMFPRGYAMIHPQKEQCITSTGDERTMADVADLLFSPGKRKEKGWFVPIAVGYMLLEDPKTVNQRKGTRNPDIAHVFAEPVMGIAELVSIRNSTLKKQLQTEDDLKRLFWKWDSRGKMILAHPAYHFNY